MSLDFRDEAESVLGWEWRILGERAEEAQRPRSRGASEGAEGQEEASVEEAEWEDGWRFKPDFWVFEVRSDLKR